MSLYPGKRKCPYKRGKKTIFFKNSIFPLSPHIRACPYKRSTASSLSNEYALINGDEDHTFRMFSVFVLINGVRDHTMECLLIWFSNVWSHVLSRRERINILECRYTWMLTKWSMENGGVTLKRSKKTQMEKN